MLIRDSRADDLDRIQSIYAHHVLNGAGSFEEVPPDIAEMARRRDDLLSRNCPYLVAELEGVLVGYAYAGPFRLRNAYRFTVEDSIYIAPDAVGKGVGRALLAALVGRCTILGFRQMIAVIGDSGNAASIGLHRHLGFEHCGTLTASGFKFGRWVDTVLMQRALGEGNGTLPPV
ncbi:GNAT family N-acetyltransferase [Azospirillum sp. SYSU D00513]|uniref:GNAT family N-acetyltransferase n=1 Tax=Azospirillum sp. SYSU D00513 TaxID=2812561 RepID=UPI001A96A829|nr:GNAT family N-acetyltransferase [Azospirillum sp. SYSU D00513]